MNAVRKLTFSKGFSLAILLVSLAWFVISNVPLDGYILNVNIFVFILGALASYPLIHGAWLDIERHWDRKVAGTGKTYRDFFSGDLDREKERNLVRYHCGSISWTIFYAFSVYFYLSFSVVYFFAPLKLYLLLAGSLFSVSLESLRFQNRLKTED
ncbi:MAG: hypothetical protein ABEJ72_02220 [Candidatus Aenigmatarchaeota archaeon]